MESGGGTYSKSMASVPAALSSPRRQVEGQVLEDNRRLLIAHRRRHLRGMNNDTIMSFETREVAPCVQRFLSSASRWQGRCSMTPAASSSYRVGAVTCVTGNDKRDKIA